MPKATEITLKLSIEVQRKSKGNSQCPGTAKLTQSQQNQLAKGDEARTHTEIYKQTNRKCQCKLKEFGKLGGKVLT